MASNIGYSVHRGSDVFFDFPCGTCQGNDKNIEAEFYCDQCTTFLCGKCMKHHKRLFQKHATLGKESISKWPVSNATSDVLDRCRIHIDRTLETFCEDHNELLCTVCHIYNHQTCSRVKLIADKVKEMHLEGELDQMTTAIKTLRTQLMQKKDYFEDSLKSLETLYKTTMEEIDNLRKAINDSLDKLQKKTIKELEASLTRLRTSIQTDIEHCNTSIKQLIEKHDWLDRKDTNEALQFIKYRTCLEELNQTKEELQQMTTKDVTTLAFCPDETIQIFVNILSGLGYIPSQVNSAPGQKGHDVYKTTMIYNKNDPESSGTSKPGRLGEEVSGIHSKAGTNPVMKVKETKHNATQSNIASATRKTISSDLHKTSSMNISSQKCDPNQLITVNSSKMTTVRMKKDSETCYISGICETATGELLVTDWNNSRIKILDKSLKVTDHCDLPGKPWSTCIIDSSLLAVALNSWEVHFIRLKKTLLGLSSLKLQHDETFKLPHSIMGIYHHQGNLYVTSGTALYHYKIDGRRLMTCDVKKMYEDTKGGMTVTSCAVSADGERIYVVNWKQRQLVTLTRDGNVVSTRKNRALRWGNLVVLPGLHVMDSGQVLICGMESHTILQVDRDGQQRMAAVVTEEDGVHWPISVYYRKNKELLIVGMKDNHNIMLFDKEPLIEELSWSFNKQKT